MPDIVSPLMPVVPFTINVGCNDSQTASFLWAQVIKGVEEQTFTRMVASDNSNEIHLYLISINDNDFVPVSGDNTRGFCSGVGTRDCNVNAQVRMRTPSAPGVTASATIRFNLEYK